MLFLTTPEVLRIAERVIPGAVVRDVGLIEAAVARPQTSVQGAYAYAGLVPMAAAFTQSLVCNHGLVDGNKRLGLACLIVFLGLNGRRLSMSNDEAHDFIYGIASGTLRSLDDIARVLEAGLA